VGSTDIKELARNAMLPIGHKIQGVGRDNRVMTVSNQVEALIREATDPVRLVSEMLRGVSYQTKQVSYLQARMYVGWMSWI
jgi:hypothetical protein